MIMGNDRHKHSSVQNSLSQQVYLSSVIANIAFFFLLFSTLFKT